MSFDDKFIKKILVSKENAPNDENEFILQINGKYRIMLDKIGKFFNHNVYAINCNIPILSHNYLAFIFECNAIPRIIFYEDDQNYNHVQDVYHHFILKDENILKRFVLINQIDILDEIKYLFKIKLIPLYIDYDELIPKNSQISFGTYPDIDYESAISLFIS